jgi:LysR family hydrogen peroxide-inducible transcriptional activator
VDSDLGITFLLGMAERSGILKNTNIKTYPLPDRSYREIALAWRKGSARAEEFRHLGGLMKKYR